MRLQGGFQKAFTLIELIATLVLLSVLGVVALARLDSFAVYDSAGYFQDTVNALRYAQKLAVSTGCTVRVTITTSPDRYALHQRDTCDGGGYNVAVASPINFDQDYQGTAPAGIDISPGATMYFTPQSTVTGLAADTPFDVDGRQFTVYRNSGLIDVP